MQDKKMFDVFMDMLKALGGQFGLVESEGPSEKTKLRKALDRLVKRPVNSGDYRTSFGGNLVRTWKKPDSKKERAKLRRGVKRDFISERIGSGVSLSEARRAYRVAMHQR